MNGQRKFQKNRSSQGKDARGEHRPYNPTGKPGGHRSPKRGFSGQRPFGDRKKTDNSRLFHGEGGQRDRSSFFDRGKQGKGRPFGNQGKGRPFGNQGGLRDGSSFYDRSKPGKPRPFRNEGGQRDRSSFFDRGGQRKPRPFHGEEGQQGRGKFHPPDKQQKRRPFRGEGGEGERRQPQDQGRPRRQRLFREEGEQRERRPFHAPYRPKKRQPFVSQAPPANQPPPTTTPSTPAPVPPATAGDQVRINRYLSMCGIASRRKAEDLVTEGRVTINGVRITSLATTLVPGKDRVFVDGKEIAQVDAPIYLALNKPKDTITTMDDERGRPTVMDHVHARKRVFPVGRLDRNTTGVLLFTNDGDFANRLMHPRYQVPKAYRVTCGEAVTHEHLRVLAEGVDLEEGRTAPAEVFSIPGGKGREVGITIREGWNRQVRRMFEALGYEVDKLDRVAYGPVTIEGLPRGATRPLTPQEIHKLKSLAGIEE